MDAIPIWAFYIAAAVIGLELGGFATLFIQRWINEQPILKPFKSRCPTCGKPLAFKDTIPVLSYILLKGRCRYCLARIGGQYPLVELSCMAWGLASAYAFGMTWDWCIYLILGIMLVTGSFIDIETMLLPDRITLGGTVLALGAGFVLENGPGWQDALLGALAGALLFWVLQQGYRLIRGQEGLGTGDIKLMAMIGAMTGLHGLLPALLIGSLTGVVGVAVLASRPKEGEGLRARIPYGPFLSLGCLLYLLYGQYIMQLWSGWR